MIPRREERDRMVRPVYIEGRQHGTYSALSIDVSECGLCLVTNVDINPGDTLTVYSKHIWPEPRTAVAVWKTRVVSESSRVGLSFCH